MEGEGDGEARKTKIYGEELYREEAKVTGGEPFGKGRYGYIGKEEGKREKEMNGSTMVNNMLEDGLQKLSRATMQLPKDNILNNNRVITQVLDDLINYLKRDAIFKALYSGIFHGGSFYDGLKVKNPDEYDIDILLDVTKVANVILNEESPGYVSIELMKGPISFQRFSYIENYRVYISAESVNRWFEGLIQRAINNIIPNTYHITTFSKSGPAKTLTITNESYSFDIDLVPCFCFHKKYWPTNCKRFKESLGFLLVPKPIAKETFWRISFPFQERDMLANKGFVKSAIRLIKLMRDQECQTLIKSYYIKTVSLHELSKYPRKYSNQSLSYTFIKMLESFQIFIEQGNLPFFWNTDLNLLKDCKRDHLINFSFRLKKLISGLKIICKSQDIWQFFKMPVIFESLMGKFGFMEMGPSYFEVNPIDSMDIYQEVYLRPMHDDTTEEQPSNYFNWVIFLAIVVFFYIHFKKTDL